MRISGKNLKRALRKKFEESAPELAQAIFEARNPYAVKEISDSNKDKVHPNFQDKKLEIMEEILRAKLKQHPSVREKLLKTGQKVIIENSPSDDYWGAGREGKGENHLGKIWMKLREEIKNNS